MTAMLRYTTKGLADACRSPGIAHSPLSAARLLLYAIPKLPYLPRFWLGFLPKILCLAAVQL